MEENEYRVFAGKSQKERNHGENLDVCGRLTSRVILENGTVWTGFNWLRTVIC
jgi:hypothetical protein